ncbi:MAG: PAS domain S-box protein [Bacteroidota bacterium]
MTPSTSWNISYSSQIADPQRPPSEVTVVAQLVKYSQETQISLIVSPNVFDLVGDISNDVLALKQFIQPMSLSRMHYWLSRRIQQGSALTLRGWDRLGRLVHLRLHCVDSQQTQTAELYRMVGWPYYPQAKGNDLLNEQHAVQQIATKPGEKLLMQISAILQEEADSAKAINRCLELLRKQFDADRAYIFKNDKQTDALYCLLTHEVCRSGVEPQLNDSQYSQFNYDLMPWWRDHMIQRKKIAVEVDSLPEPERSILKAQDIVSLLALPLWVEEQWLGFIGLDYTGSIRTWKNEEIRLLAAIARQLSMYLLNEQTQEALNETDRLYRELFEQSNDAIVLMKEGRLKKVNDAASKLFGGKSRSELKGRSVRSLSSEYQLGNRLTSDVIKEKQQELRDGQGDRFEWIIENVEGQQRICNVRLSPIEVNGERISMAILRDITEERKKQRRLELLEKVINQTEDVLFVTDHDMTKPGGPTILLANKAAADQYGTTIEELEGKSVAVLQPANKLEEYREKILSYMELEEPFSLILKNEKKSGELFYVEVNAEPITNDEGEVAYWIGFNRDITKLKQLDRLTAIADQVFNAVYLTDDQNRIIWVNQGFSNLLGYDHAEVVGEEPSKLLHHPEADQSVIDKISEGRINGEFVSEEVISKTKTGESKWVRIHVSPLVNDEEELEGSVNILADIDRQKEVEHRLRDSLQQKNMLIKEVHHRVKNNLAVISSLLEMHSDEINGPAASALDESRMRIVSMSKVHELLYKSETSGQIELDYYLFELIYALDESYGFWKKGIRINTQLQSGGVTIGLDEAIPLGLILNEMFANISKHAFGKEGGSIRIRLTGDQSICLNIEDDGVGMPKKVQQELNLEPNSVDEQVWDSDSLGFEIVRSLVKQLHGTLTVESRPKQGMRFEFMFPLP